MRKYLLIFLVVFKSIQLFSQNIEEIELNCMSNIYLKKDTLTLQLRFTVNNSSNDIVKWPCIYSNENLMERLIFDDSIGNKVLFRRNPIRDLHSKGKLKSVKRYNTLYMLPNFYFRPPEDNQIGYVKYFEIKPNSQREFIYNFSYLYKKPQEALDYIFSLDTINIYCQVVFDNTSSIDRLRTYDFVENCDKTNACKTYSFTLIGISVTPIQIINKQYDESVLKEYIRYPIKNPN